MSLTRSLFVVILLFSLSAVGWAGQADAIDIGSRRELFIDDLLIDRMTGARWKALPWKIPSRSLGISWTYRGNGRAEPNWALWRESQYDCASS